MVTIRVGKRAIGVCLLLLAVGCSREQQDWRSAETTDTIESYGQFIQRHPESELATQARTRVVQLGEDRDWQHAGSADTVEAYRQFIAQHPNGKWTQEARIRIENFSLGEQAGTDAGSKAGVSAAAGRGKADTSGGSQAGSASAEAPGTASGAGAAALAASATTAGTAVPSGGGLAAPGEAAAPARRDSASSGVGAAATGVGASAGFGVQLGAFSSEANANNEWRALAGRFGPELQGLHHYVVTADTPSGRIYRLQAAVGDESRARAICDSLRKRAQACVPVLPH